MKRVKCFLLLLAVSCSLQLTVREARSCSVPVFRYALERWKPDPYKGIYIHRGPLTKQDQVFLRQLESVAQNPESPLNLLIRPVETAAFGEEKLKELLKGPIPDKLPALAIWYPDQMGKKAPLWKLEATPVIVNALAKSPKRRQLTESLIGGESIVWIFVPSGNPQKDERAKTLIRRELDLALDSVAKAPFFVQSGVKKKKLSYGFPMLAISPKDPQERFFLDMLLHCESDLSEHKDEPMVFPVFGRGRLLGCLFGEYINEKSIQEIVSYLAAACSCNVKAQHPGMDLLLSAFWDKVTMGEIFADDDDQLPELTSVMPESPKPVKNATTETEKPPMRTGIYAIYGITLGAVVVVVAVASLVLNHRRKENR
jgi:hypothetical protein